MTENCDYCDLECENLTKCESFFLCPACTSARNFVLPQLRRDTLLTKILLCVGLGVSFLFLYFLTRLR